jgi:response regulator RpfG family c-di-GMP phosphodiesterase
VENRPRQASALVVDDVPGNLELLCSMLRRLGHEPRPVTSRALAIAAARVSPPDIVFLDIMMPGMDGYAVLHVLKSDPLLQHIPVIIVSALDERDGAIRCIEEGADDYLIKPVNETLLHARLNAGLERKRHHDREHELLERTLSGTASALTGILARVSPLAFERTSRLLGLVQRMARGLDVGVTRELRLAAMLSQLGCLGIPTSLLQRAYAGEPLGPDEQALYDSHPQWGSELIRTIPRLEGAASAIAYQHKYADGSGYPADALAGNDIPFVARALRLATAYDQLAVAGTTPIDAVTQLTSQAHLYDPMLVEALAGAVLVGG